MRKFLTSKWAKVVVFALGMVPAILLTNSEVKSFADACLVIDWYEARWTIEDYHKCQKTGCKIEKPPSMEGKRLTAMLAPK